MRRGLWLLCAGLFLPGCGQDGPAPAGGQPAPVASLAALGSQADLRREVLTQGLALGLDRLALPASGSPEEQAALAHAAARPLPEPAAPLARATPEALLDSVRELLSARDLADPAALARVVYSRTERPVLTEDDAAEVRRRFLGPRTRDYWARLLGAVDAGGFTVVHEDEREALLRVDVGGAAGSYLLRLRREGDEWFLVG